MSDRPTPLCHRMLPTGLCLGSRCALWVGERTGGCADNAEGKAWADPAVAVVPAEDYAALAEEFGLDWDDDFEQFTLNSKWIVQSKDESWSLRGVGLFPTARAALVAWRGR
jgi:hypothetical protein